MRLEDKVIVITGSGSGLGPEGALICAAEGATVFTSDLVPGRAGGTYACTSIIFPTDPGQSDDITCGAILEELRGQIDR